MTLHSG